MKRLLICGLLRWDGKGIRAGRRVRLVGDLRKNARRICCRAEPDELLFFCNGNGITPST